jgi:AAA family ATP:ADP antiporter
VAPDHASLGPLDRALRLFADVRGGEGLTSLLLMLNLFLILAAYYLLKTIREPLILAGEGGGAEVKSYSAAAIAALLIVLVPLYSALASRVSRLRLINGVTLFFIANLVIFFALARAGVPVGVPFYIWVGIFNLMIIAQVWAFANDVYTTDQGKRLFAIVGFGASLGAIAGSFVTGNLVKRYGPFPFMIAAAALLLLCLLMANVIHVREGRRRSAARAGAETHPTEIDRTLRGRSGFQLVLSDRYLLLIAALMAMLNLVNTTGEYILGKTVTRLAEDAAMRSGTGMDAGRIIGGFYGDYFTWVNVVSALIQALLVSRVFKVVGVRGALLVLPLVALGGYATLAFFPLLGIIKSVKISENSIDYSLQNTTRNALYLPTSREVKYKAKQANDAFFVRLGDVMSAGVVWAGVNLLDLSPQQFALVNVAFVILWLFLALAIGRRFQQMAKTA